MSFTEGPWQTGGDMPGQVWCQKHGLTVAMCGTAVGDFRKVPVSERDANARLISAAPELFDAAKLALRLAESWIHDQLDGTRSIEQELAKLLPVRAAIAKAESVDVT